jgi:hypothetical protein
VGHPRINAQRQALADAIPSLSDKDHVTWEYAYKNLAYTGKTKGGNANFQWLGFSDDLDFIPYYSGGGCEILCRAGGVPSIHMPGGYVLHLDAGNPLWGFGLGAVVHGTWDLGINNLNGSVPSLW